MSETLFYTHVCLKWPNAKGTDWQWLYGMHPEEAAQANL